MTALKGVAHLRLARPSLRRLTRRALARPALRGLQAFKAGIFVDVKKEVDGGGFFIFFWGGCN